MKNKQLLSLLGCSLAALPSMVVAQQKVDKRPNILFILSDDHARTAVSAYGGINAKLAPTPNIDAIGHNGAIMENMLCTNSISGPSRACLLTGKYSTTHGFYQNEGGIVFDNTQQQYQKILRENGYTTALFGKWHLFSDPAGFDYYKIHANPSQQGTYWDPVYSTNGKKKKEYWKGIQAIFQDPFASYNMFKRVDSVLLDCINMRGDKNLPKEEKERLMTEACSFVNLKYAELTNKYPFELSGGQMQRLMIARIFLLKPKILLADEPTSMIDACSRATILDMLLKLRDEINMTIIFITHDIGLAYYVSDNVYIMEHGKFVESGPAEEVILHPTAAYTKRLISDVPKIYEPWDLTTV